ncbi:unnamed protein product [Chrysodeixis includens]|uniref:Uncharacterized protein n=1 Tax=Chrysodeixis includens TaxID=689277 RepID=A0A9N8KY21_CHRIL|nr:unnamed protein product [Chrysodeixis includens]
MASKVSYLIILGIISFSSGKPALKEETFFVKNEQELQRLLMALAYQGKYDIELSNFEDSPESLHEDKTRMLIDDTPRQLYRSDKPAGRHSRGSLELDRGAQADLANLLKYNLLLDKNNSNKRISRNDNTLLTNLIGLSGNNFYLDRADEDNENERANEILTFLNNLQKQLEENGDYEGFFRTKNRNDRDENDRDDRYGDRYDRGNRARIDDRDDRYDDRDDRGNRGRNLDDRGDRYDDRYGRGGNQARNLRDRNDDRNNRGRNLDDRDDDRDAARNGDDRDDRNNRGDRGNGDNRDDADYGNNRNDRDNRYDDDRDNRDALRDKDDDINDRDTLSNRNKDDRNDRDALTNRDGDDKNGRDTLRNRNGDNRNDRDALGNRNDNDRNDRSDDDRNDRNDDDRNDRDASGNRNDDDRNDRNDKDWNDRDALDRNDDDRIIWDALRNRNDDDRNDLDRNDRDRETLRCRGKKCTKRIKYNRNDGELRFGSNNYIKKYKLNDDTDAIVLGLSDVDRLLTNLNPKPQRSNNKLRAQKLLGSIDLEKLLNRAGSSKGNDKRSNVEAVVFDLTQLENGNALAKQIQRLLTTTKNNDDEGLDAEYADYGNFVEDNLKLGSFNLKKKAYKSRSNSKIVAHSEDNNNVYVPKWLLSEVLTKSKLRDASPIQLLKSVLPLTKQKKSKALRSNKKGRVQLPIPPKKMFRRNFEQDVGVPFHLEVQGLGQVKP